MTDEFEQRQEEVDESGDLDARLDQDSEKNVITPRDRDYSAWYLDIIKAGKLADNSPVRGCMVIRENGYALWENIQSTLDKMFKEKGVRNAYFPLFIPKSFFEKEAEHVEGFAKECAVVTHSRLKSEDGKLVPDGKLDEPLIVRPTSETIIYSMYSKWINSFRDLPVLINQWANIVRWELRTRPFLRTTEFLWQEGHTAHATEQEAETMTLEMLDVYAKFAEEYLAIPVIKGKKSESEKFAGAVFTTSIEAMMQDGKALQCGTSHMLGQNFAKPFEVKYLSSEGKEEYVWQTSWGISTRIIGAIIMAHSDDIGLVLPPKIAPIQAVIIPITKDGETDSPVTLKAKEIKEKLNAIGIKTEIDLSLGRPGAKYFAWERQGVPVRLEIGPRDMDNNQVIAVRRDNSQKVEVKFDELENSVKKMLEDIQKSLLDKALEFQKNKTFETESYEELKDIFAKENAFVYADWCGEKDCESKIQEETGATTRCIPFDQKPKNNKCIACDREATVRVVFDKAY
jgi:prolyl-tRNA synthetase